MAPVTITVYTTVAAACSAMRGEQFVGSLLNTDSAFGRTKLRVALTISTADWRANPDTDATRTGVITFFPAK